MKQSKYCLTRKGVWGAKGVWGVRTIRGFIVYSGTKAECKTERTRLNTIEDARYRKVMHRIKEKQNGGIKMIAEKHAITGDVKLTRQRIAKPFPSLAQLDLPASFIERFKTLRKECVNNV